jgi:hypothetical protein
MFRKTQYHPLSSSFRVLLCVFFATIVSACAQSAPQQIEVTREVSATLEVTRIVPQTVEVTRIVEVVVTATSTPAPTATPKPAFQKYGSADVIQAFRAAGLEIGETSTMGPQDYGAAPMTAVEGTRFLIPSLGEDKGGRVLSFSSSADIEPVRAYYTELGKASALFFSWVFVNDNILVQINGNLPEEQARQYEAALGALP